MAACKLIVHADDFGLSQLVNDGIVDAHCNGIVTSASLMATGEAFDHAIQLSRSLPKLDLGVHLTLVEEKPLLRSESIPTLVNNNGFFFDHATTFVKKYMLRKISLEEVRLELDAQIRKILNSGIKISHLDSHQHVHMLPGIRSVVGNLANKYSIPAIRCPKEPLMSYMLKEKSEFARSIQLLGLRTFCAFANTNGAKHADHFFGFFYGGRLTKDRLWKLLQKLPPNSTCELMCHPGKDDVVSQYNHWEYNWQEELNALTNRDIKEYIKTRGIKLISYSDLNDINKRTASVEKSI